MTSCTLQLFKLGERNSFYYAVIWKICLLLSSKHFVVCADGLSLLWSQAPEPGAHSTRPSLFRVVHCAWCREVFPSGPNTHCYYLIEEALGWSSSMRSRFCLILLKRFDVQKGNCLSLAFYSTRCTAAVYTGATVPKRKAVKWNMVKYADYFFTWVFIVCRTKAVNRMIGTKTTFLLVFAFCWYNDYSICTVIQSPQHVCRLRRL